MYIYTGFLCVVYIHKLTVFLENKLFTIDPSKLIAIHPNPT